LRQIYIFLQIKTAEIGYIGLGKLERVMSHLRLMSVVSLGEKCDILPKNKQCYALVLIVACCVWLFLYVSGCISTKFIAFFSC
jgi:hypothetical protein